MDGVQAKTCAPFCVTLGAMEIDDFLSRLVQMIVPSHVFNQYDFAHDANAIRRHNLRLYLAHMSERRPHILLVGEAAGYRGCRLTGVPFTSPFIMRHGLDAVDLFGLSRGFQVSDEWPHIQREASATIVWNTLSAGRALPLLWNAFPFHPFRPGEPQSNRTPVAGELRLGQPFWQDLLQIYPVTTVIAVGNRANSALSPWFPQAGVAFRHVRHPAQGGKADFVRGMQAVMAKANARRP